MSTNYKVKLQSSSSDSKPALQGKKSCQLESFLKHLRFIFISIYSSIISNQTFKAVCRVSTNQIALGTDNQIHWQDQNMNTSLPSLIFNYFFRETDRVHAITYLIYWNYPDVFMQPISDVCLREAKRGYYFQSTFLRWSKPGQIL